MATLIDRCDFKPGDVVDGKYRVTGELGEGSFGKVYKVVDQSARVYAMKLLRLWDVHPDIRDTLVARFKMEYDTGCIRCDNLVQAVDYGIVGGNPFIVMEFCSGGDMTPLLGNPAGREVAICRHILCGLQALHLHGKVHRDLKPENVLFKASGVAALTDFGISGDRNHRMTERNILGRPKQVFGTYAYMPPEQVNRSRGQATVLPTTDIFSFGVLVFQLITGQLPFGDLEELSDLPSYQRRAKEGVWRRDALCHLTSAKIWTQLLDGCLNPNFKNRTQSVDLVLDQLRCIDGTDPVEVPVPMFAPLTARSSVHGECVLRILQGQGYGSVCSLNSLLGDGMLVTIGRAAHNRLCLKEEGTYYLSRRHCCIETDSARSVWTLRDGQWDSAARSWIRSSNGTFINSKSVNEYGMSLTHGDIIALGDYRLRFESK